MRYQCEGLRYPIHVSITCPRLHHLLTAQRLSHTFAPLTPHAVLTSNPHHHTGGKCWSLKCREADTEEVERANASLPEPPAAIMLEGAALPGGLAAGFAGLYTRGTEVTGKPPTKQFREVNGGIDTRRVSNTVDEPHAPHSCVPVHACSHACSILRSPQPKITLR